MKYITYVIYSCYRLYGQFCKTEFDRHPEILILVLKTIPTTGDGHGITILH